MVFISIKGVSVRILTSICFVLFFSLLSHAQLSLNPAPVSGDIQLTASQTYIYLTNNALSSISTNLTVDSNSAGISISLNRCATMLAKQTCYVVISFSNYGKLTSPVSVSFKNSGSPLALLKYSPVISVVESSSFSISSLSVTDFSNYTLSITNKTLSTKSYSPIFSGTDSSKFSIALNRCSNIPAGGKCDIIIKLSQQLAGSYSASLSEAQVTGSVSISALITNSTVGVIPPPNPSVSVSPSSIDFGTLTILGQSATQTAIVTNNGNVSVSPIISVQGSGLSIALNRCLILLTPGSSCSVSLYFNAINTMMNGSQSGLSFNAQANSSTSVVSIPVSVNLNIPVTLLSQNASVNSPSRVFVGEENVCSLSMSGILYCWGGGPDSNYNALPQNGSPTPYNMNSFFPSAALPIKSLSFNSFNYCVIGHDNLAYCDGPTNSAGGLGNGSYNFYNGNQPTQMLMTGDLVGKTVKQVSVGHENTCIIASDDYAYCAGHPDLLGSSGHLEPSLVLIPVDRSGALAGKTVKQILLNDIGDSACLLASDNKIYCWGWNDRGVLGNGTFDYSAVPVAVDMSGVLAGKTFKSLPEKFDSTMCAIASDDRVYCWGDGFRGLLGDNSTSDSPVPVAVDWSGVLAGKKAKKVNENCLIADDNQLYCWSSFNSFMTTSSSRLPILIDTSAMGSAHPTSISIGPVSFCADSSDNKTYCWGENDYGTMGNGSYNYDEFYYDPQLITFP